MSFLFLDLVLKNKFLFFFAEKQMLARPWAKTDRICSIDTLSSFTTAQLAAAAAEVEVMAAEALVTALDQVHKIISLSLIQN